MLQAESSFNPNAKSVVRGKDYVSYGQLGAAAAQTLELRTGLIRNKILKDLRDI